MMKLSRTVSYGVQAMLLLAQEESGTPVPCSRLAAHGHMPERFLLQILRNLVTHGLLHSTRGVEGGYGLEKQPQQISLLDVIEAIEGPVTSTIPLPEHLAPELQVRLRQALDRITANCRRELASIRLSDLLP